ncbi:MAG: hypothetical protein M0Q21_04330 [Ignavibacteriaceae bacterium]|nr:hypothetical protein [Ignavibacteriaceae bacterium]
MKFSLLPYRKPVGILLVLVLILFVQSCGIKSPTAPSWDIALNLPLVDTTYSILDMIKNDSSIVKPDYTKQGLLVYNTVKEVEKIEVSDKLTVDGFSTNTSKQIGSISINGDSTKADIGFDWSQHLSGLPPGTQVPILAENNRAVSADLAAINQFQSAKFESGTIIIEIKNNFAEHVTLTIDGLTIKNSATNEIVAQTTAQLVVPPNSSRSFPPISFNTNVTVKNQLKFETTVSISGSGTNLVTVPQTAFSVTTKFSTLSVSEASAKIPQQNPVTIDSSIIMDETSAQPTKFKKVLIATGTINITLRNNLDVDANVTMEIANLKNASNVKFSVSKTILRKSTTKYVDNVSLTDYSLVSLDNNPTNKINYKVTFTSQASSDYRTINKTDDFQATVDFSSLGIKEFDGVVKPTALDETRSAINLDTKELQKKFGFHQINFNNPLIELHLVPSAGAKINFKIDGRLEAQNELGEKSILFLNANTMDKTTITETDSVIKLNSDSVSNFFKKFTRLPDSIFVIAGGTLNANYQQVTVTNTSYVSGSSKIELPLDLGISDGLFADSVKMDFDIDKQKRIRDLNTSDINLILTNGLAVSFTFTGKMYDSTNTLLMYFPPKHTDQDTAITVSGGVTDANGNVITKTTQSVAVKIASGESDLIARAKYMRIFIKLNTSRSNNLPVKFKTKDDIRIESFGGVNYRVNP